MNEQSKKLLYGISTSGFAKVSTNLVNFVLLIILARLLEPFEFGAVSFIFATVAILNAISDFGITPALQKYLPEHKNKNVEEIINAALFLKIFFSFILGLLVLLLGAAGAFKGYAVYIFALVLANSFAILAMIYNAKMKFKKAAIIQILMTGFYFILAIILTLAKYGIKGIIFANIISYLVIGIPLLFFLVRRVRVSYKILRMITLFGFLYSIITFLNILFAKLDILFITYLVDLASAGIYRTAITLSSFIGLVSPLIVTPLLPQISELFELKKNKEIRNIHRMLTVYLALFLIPLVILGILFGQILITFIFGIKYSLAVAPFKMLLVSAALSVISTSYFSILLVKKQLKALIIIAVITALLNIAGNSLLIPLFGINGAAVTTLIVQAIGTFLILIYFEKIKYRFVLK